jgi:hypothetical protein
MMPPPTCSGSPHSPGTGQPFCPGGGELGGVTGPLADSGQSQCPTGAATILRTCPRKA